LLKIKNNLASLEICCNFVFQMKNKLNKNAIILANGEFPKRATLLEKLRACKGVLHTPDTMIICCDGAVQNLLDFGIEPDFIIGDLDSISKENKIKFADILICDENQDTNDLTKAVKFCIKNGVENLEILGATGCREDHTLGNISLLANYMDEIISVKMFTDYGVFTPISETTTFESFPNQAVSIFSITPETLITSENLAYPIRNQSFHSWWEGTLNRSLGETFTIKINIGKIIVFQEL
jgi:thiamine pyrophosphokinase